MLALCLGTCECMLPPFQCWHVAILDHVKAHQADYRKLTFLDVLKVYEQ